MQPAEGLVKLFVWSSDANLPLNHFEHVVDGQDHLIGAIHHGLCVVPVVVGLLPAFVMLAALSGKVAIFSYSLHI